jgi:hypothetical protein
MNDDAELQEYFALVKTLSEFDQRLLTVKSWGVTLSLVALGFGFQYCSYGMFLVAAGSSLAFWSLEAAMKRHQMRHYPRMRQIEVNRYSRASDQERHLSAPRIDWSWVKAKGLLRGELNRADAAPQPRGPDKWYGLAWLLAHVMLPHVITFLIGSLLFLLGYYGCLAGFELGPGKCAG